MFRLKELVLQSVGLNRKDLIQISEFCTVVQTLKTLNISNNGLNMSDLVAMFEMLQPQTFNMLSLNLSWNAMSD